MFILLILSKYKFNSRKYSLRRCEKLIHRINLNKRLQQLCQYVFKGKDLRKKIPPPEKCAEGGIEVLCSRVYF